MRYFARYQGFTLIELVVASAIAVVLMGGLLAVLSAIARDRARLASAGWDSEQDRSQIVELLRRDMACASSVQSDRDNMLVLNTNGSLDAKTLARVDRPTSVTYQLVSDEESHWLIREQQFTDEPVAPRPSKNLVACQVRRLFVQPMEDALEQPSKSNLAPAADLPKPVPSRFLVQIEFDDAKDNIQQIVCLR